MTDEHKILIEYGQMLVQGFLDGINHKPSDEEERWKNVHKKIIETVNAIPPCPFVKKN